MAADLSLVGFQSRAVMAERLADMVEAVLARAIAENGSAVLAVSGGSTPAGLYEALSKRSLDWAKVTAVLVDERWVPPGAAGSNESFVRDTLLRNKAVAVKLVGLWSDAPSSRAGLEATLVRFGDLGETIDAVVLGMGNDGHTASWFPHCQGLDAALAEAGPRLAAITATRSAVTGDHLERITLTLGAVKAARFVCLLLAGDDKRATFTAAAGDGAVAEMPVRAILRARPDLWTCWAP